MEKIRRRGHCQLFIGHRGRIREASAFHSRPRVQRERSSPTGACDLFHMDATCEQGIGDEGTMATPGNGFGTHDCSPRGAGHGDEFLKMEIELRRLHVIGESAEAEIAPGKVLRGAFAGMAKAAEPRHVHIAAMIVLESC